MTSKQQILSIDIGVRNLAMWVEEFDGEKLQEFKKQYKTINPKLVDNNLPSEAYKTFLDNFLLTSSKTIWADKIDLCEDEKVINKTKNHMIILNNNILFNVIKQFDKRRDILINVDTIVIERQLKDNPNAQVIQNHIHAYLLHQYGLSKNVVIFDSCHKTRVLGCPKKVATTGAGEDKGKMVKINKTFRKKWTTNLTRRIMFDRKDKTFYNFVFEQNKSKADDLSDTFCQACAYVLLNL
jgi:hypothetical protein